MRLLLALAALVLAPSALAQSAADAVPQPVGGLDALAEHVAYPAEAEARGIEGRVVVQLVVSAEGAVEQAGILESAHPALDAAALDAVLATRFEPARHDGRAVRAELALPIFFELTGGLAPVAVEPVRPAALVTLG